MSSSIVLNNKLVESKYLLIIKTNAFEIGQNVIFYNFSEKINWL